MRTSEAHPVVAAVDGSRTHQLTLDLAADEAARRGAPLLVLHVWPGQYTGRYRCRGAVPVETDARRLLDAATRRARQRAPWVAVRAELTTGNPAGTLAEHSGTASLVVIGRRDEGPARPGWGSTADYLARHSRSPLLVQRGGGLRTGPVVLAVDGSDGPPAALQRAFEEAGLAGARLVVVAVWNPDDVPDRRAARRRLVDLLAAWAGRYPGVPVEPLVVSEPELPYTLDRASHRSQLLITGAGRRTRLAELVRGSPVMLVPDSFDPDSFGPDSFGPDSFSAAKGGR